MSMNPLHKIALSCLRASRRDSPTIAKIRLLAKSEIAKNRLFIDGRMCVVRLRGLPVSVQRRPLLACGSTVILLCEANGGPVR